MLNDFKEPSHFENEQYKAYTYLLIWGDMKYYGVRYNKKCNVNDLWKTYFTSSQHVKKYTDNYKIHPDKILIHRIFETAKEAREFESQYLISVDAKHDPYYLNKTNCSAPNNKNGIFHPSYNPKKHYIYHPNHGILYLTRLEFTNKFPDVKCRFYSLVSGEHMMMCGWIVVENDDLEAAEIKYNSIVFHKKNVGRDKNLYTLYSKETGFISATRQQFFEDYKISDVQALINRKKLISKGWMMVYDTSVPEEYYINELNKNILSKRDNKKYVFYKFETDDIIIKTKHELNTMLDTSKAYKIANNIGKTIRGWVCCGEYDNSKDESYYKKMGLSYLPELITDRRYLFHEVYGLVYANQSELKRLDKNLFDSGVNNLFKKRIKSTMGWRLVNQPETLS